MTKMTGAGGDYCALSRKFQYKTILTIAKNSMGESTLAIDFQRPILKSSETLKITLDPGHGVLRKFDVEAISNQAVVVKLGADQAFFNAIEATEFLRVSTGGQTYSFNINDYDGGRIKMVGCVDALPTQHVSQTTPFAPVNAISAKDESLAPPPVPFTNAAELPHEVESLKAQLAQVQAQNKSLSEKVKRAEAPPISDTTKPERKINTKGNVPTKNSWREQLAKQRELASGVSGSLKISPTPLQNDEIAILPPLKIEEPVPLTPLPIANSAPVVPKKVWVEDTQKINQLADEIRRLKQDNSSLQAALQAEKNKAEPVSAINQNLDKINELQIQNAALKSELMDLQSEHSNQIENAKNIVSARESDLAQLSQSQITAMNSLKAELVQLKERNTVQAEELLRVSQQSIVAEELKGRMAALEDENTQLKAAVAAQGDENGIVLQLQDQLANLQRQNAAFASQIKSMKLAASSNVSIKDGTNDKQLAALKAENEGLQNRLALQRDSIQKFIDRIAFLESENDALEQTVASYQVQHERLAQIKTEVRAQDKTVSQLSKTLEHKDAAISNLSENLEARQQTLAALEAENSALKSRLISSVAVKAEPRNFDKTLSSALAQQDVEAAVPDNSPQEFVEKNMADATPPENTVADTLSPPPIEEILEVAEMADVSSALSDSGNSVDVKKSVNPAQSFEQQLKKDMGVLRSENAPSRIESAEVAAKNLNAPPVNRNATPTQSGPTFKVFSVPALVKSASGVDAQLLQNASNETRRIYQWKTGGLFGSAEQIRISGDTDYESAVLSYLERAQSRCKGEFAVELNATNDYNGVRIDNYDMACVGTGVNSSAAISFVNTGESLSTFAHEGPSETLGEAMAVREKVVKTIVQGS
ncbi:MAG: hypothetical protein KTR28_06760 [Micavibrio sp.]|nr:hypothetical protein [Micavibrio sp.]